MKNIILIALCAIAFGPRPSLATVDLTDVLDTLGKQQAKNAQRDASRAAAAQAAAENSVARTAPRPDPAVPSLRDMITSSVRASWGVSESQLGREVDDLEFAAGLFDDEETVKALLSEEPAYIYRPDDLPDPMLIPWKRWEAVAGDLIADAKLLQGKDRGKALEILQRIVDDREMAKTKAAVQARALIKQINAQIAEEERRAEEARLAEIARKQKEAEAAQAAKVAAAQQNALVKPKLELPSPVRNMVVAIYWSADDPRIMLADDLLQEGDPAPGYPEVVIKKIEKKRVVFHFDERDHVVNIDALRPEVKEGIR